MWEAENRVDHVGSYTQGRWNITEKIIAKEWRDGLVLNQELTLAAVVRMVCGSRRIWEEQGQKD